MEDTYYDKAEQRVLMFVTVLFISEVEKRQELVKGFATALGNLTRDRDEWEKRARELESLCADRL